MMVHPTIPEGYISYFQRSIMVNQPYAVPLLIDKPMWINNLAMKNSLKLAGLRKRTWSVYVRETTPHMVALGGSLSVVTPRGSNVLRPPTEWCSPSRYLPMKHRVHLERAWFSKSQVHNPMAPKGVWFSWLNHSYFFVCCWLCWFVYAAAVPVATPMLDQSSNDITSDIHCDLHLSYLKLLPSHLDCWHSLWPLISMHFPTRHRHKLTSGELVLDSVDTYNIYSRASLEWCKHWAKRFDGCENSNL